MATLAPVLARKLKKVLETRTDSPDLLASLAVLSSFYNDNTMQARRDLRTSMEKRGLSINEEFLQASEAAQKALDAVETEVGGLSACCERISASLNSCSALTGNMVAATERLKQELDNVTNRQEEVSTFLHNYQLTPEEVSALRDEELDEGFFKALSRVQEIHANCKVLLRTHHQRAGLELMDVMAVYQEGAYERLCRWVQTECRSLGDNDTPEVSELLKTAARSLRERPVLFKYCAEEVANTRHNAMFRRFIGALTRGGPGGMPRPIEVHAHDPLRYVGDMLGWLHQALASERELAAALFSHDTSVEKSASRRFSKEGLSSDPSQMEITDMSSVLDRIFEGVCRPFKVRVDQVLTSQPGIVLAYKLSNLLDFYTHTIGELLGERAALMVTLAEVRDTSVRVFYDLMKSKGEKLVKYPPPIAADLSPPPAVGETVSLVLELLDAYKTAMVSAGSKPDFEPVLAALLDPLQQMCERAAEAYGVKTLVSPLQWKGGDSRDSSARRLSGPSPVGGLDGSRHAGHASSDGQNFSNWPSLLPDDSLKTVRRIFLINCYSAIEHPLLPYDVTVARTEALRAVIQEHIATLVEHEVNVILDRCGLATKVEIIQERKVGAGRGMTGRLCDAEEMSAAAVAESARSLFTLLAVEGALPEFVHMQIPRLRADACNKVASALANAYETLYDAVLDPESGYIAAGQLLRHTPGQLRTILGI